MKHPVSTEISDGILSVTIDNPPVNALSAAVRAGLMAAREQAVAARQVRAVVLAAAGRTFVAGADIREFNAPPSPPLLPELVAAIEETGKPWVALLHGTVLGGGLELALGCHARLARPGTALGLPEVRLGLIPGAGGTVRLPRLIGALPALEMITGGRPVNAEQAQETGLIDAITTGDPMAEARARALALAGAAPPKGLIARAAPEIDDAGVWDKALARVAAKARGQIAPVEAAAAVADALRLPAGAALAAERQRFMALKDSPQSAALRHVFFAERAAGKMPELADVRPRPLQRIGIVGGGTMGAGIAAACLMAGLPVTMVERDGALARRGAKNLRTLLDGSLGRGVIDRSAHDRALAGFAAGDDLTALAPSDLVIEAIVEDMEEKAALLSRLEAVVGPDTVLASNTSYLDIDQMSDGLADPGRVIGLHFFSPAHVMKLLELVITARARDDVVATGRALGRLLGKIVVPARVGHGFIGNRIMSAYRRACEAMLQDGALPAEIDAAMRDYGYAMGMFEMQDMAGLDIAWAMRRAQAAGSAGQETPERYVDIADRLCEAGRFGRKSGAGWYRYDDGHAVPDPEVSAIITASSARAGITRRRIGAEEIMERCLGAMIEAGRAVLAEGIARSAADIDVVMVNGFGFPRWRGGPFHAAGISDG